MLYGHDLRSRFRISPCLARSGTAPLPQLRARVIVCDQSGTRCCRTVPQCSQLAEQNRRAARGPGSPFSHLRQAAPSATASKSDLLSSQYSL